MVIGRKEIKRGAESAAALSLPSAARGGRKREGGIEVRKTEEPSGGALLPSAVNRL
jgi:hypothetical protein